MEDPKYKRLFKKSHVLRDVGILADGTLYNPHGYPEDVIRAARQADRQKRNEKRAARAAEKKAEEMDSRTIAWAEQGGRESLIWQKIKHLTIPFWDELVELVDEDEWLDLLSALDTYLTEYERAKRFPQC